MGPQTRASMCAPTIRSVVKSLSAAVRGALLYVTLPLDVPTVDFKTFDEDLLQVNC